MIGGVIITHGSLAASLLEVAETISGEIEGIRTVSLGDSDSSDRLRDDLMAAIGEMDNGDGVVVFTDMFGGTPSNIALSLYEAGRVEVVTGANLPVLIKFISHRSDKSLDEIAQLLKETGTQSIVLASDMLKEK
jgi:PTS system mannose-specific IIA component